MTLLSSKRSKAFRPHGLMQIASYDAVVAYALGIPGCYFIGGVR